MPVRGVIFDVDGTLVDSNDAHAHAWVAAFAEYGYAVDFGAVRRCIGMGGDKLMPAVSGLRDDEEPGQSIAARRSAIFLEAFLPALQPFPDVQKLVLRIRDAGLKMVVASSAQKQELAPLLRVAKVEHLLAERTSSDDAAESKPDPDIIHAALERLDLAPDETLMIGDTPYDLAAASQAGVGMIALRCGGWGAADLAGALAIYADPAELLARYAESPLAGTQSHGA